MNPTGTMNITLSEDLILQITATLKQVDARGYDSMDRLVGTVTLLENIVSQAHQIAAQQAQEQAKPKANRPAKLLENQEADNAQEKQDQQE